MSRFLAPFPKLVAAVLSCLIIVEVASAQSKPFTSSYLDREGVLLPYYDVDVATTEVGIVRSIFVKAGDRVVEGQPIATLDSEILKAQIRVKESEVESRGRIGQAKAELDLQKKKIDRLLKVYDSGNMSRLELDRAESDLQIAQARLLSEEDSIHIQSLELERLQKSLAERTIRAPSSGIVTEVVKGVGEFVATNSPNVARIVDHHKLKATFSMTESEISGIKAGNVMKVQVHGGDIMEGVIEFVPPVADPATGWFMVVVVLDNADERIIASKCQRVP